MKLVCPECNGELTTLNAYAPEIVRYDIVFAGRTDHDTWDWRQQEVVKNVEDEPIEYECPRCNAHLGTVLGDVKVKLLRGGEANGKVLRERHEAEGAVSG